MKTILLSKIFVRPDRQRKEFDLAYISDLAESIKKGGLQNAPVLRPPAADEPKGFLTLVSGECRMRAIGDIWELGDSFRYDNDDVPRGEIPYTMLGELSELAREEAEYDENTKRRNLTWIEEASATRRLALARAKAGVKVSTPQVLREGVNELTPEIVRGVTQTALPETASKLKGELGVHQEKTRRQIIVAKHFDDPDITSAKTVDEAFKILKKKEETAKRVAMAVKVGATYTSDVHTVLNTDSLAWMAKAEAGQFDVICTDPIFGINAHKFGDSGGYAEGAHDYDDSYEKWKADITVLAREGFRICKSEAHLYAFCDITKFEEFKKILEAEGWEPFRTPITWINPQGNRTPWVDFGPQRKTGWILYAKKGRRPVTRIYPDYVVCGADENLGHNAQKPVALIVDLLRRSCNPGDTVLDPFAGSGPILEAAQELKIKATAVEIKADKYAICLQRLNKLKDVPELSGL